MSKKTKETEKKTNATTKKTTESPKKTSASTKKTTKTTKKTSVLKAKEKLRVVLDQKTKKTLKSPQKTIKSNKTDQIDTFCLLLERNGNNWSGMVIPHEKKNSPKHFSLLSTSPKSPEKDQNSPLGLGIHLPLAYDSDNLESFSSSPDQSSSDIDLFDQESSEVDTETAEEPLESSKISRTVLETQAPYNGIQ